MARLHRLSRRSFLSDMGGGTLAVAVFGLAACSTDNADSAVTSDEGATTSSDGTTTAPTADETNGTAASAPESDDSLRWERVTLGSVSAYVLARGSEFAIVDTGNPGSEAEILSVIEALGGNWADVDHVIATHGHGDHVGSMASVLTAAAAATGYAGVADLGSIQVDRDLVGLNDGDEVFGLQILGTPGHTAGHISVYDEAAGVLIAGDAINSDGGEPTGPNPRFSADIDLANTSAMRLGELRYDTLLVGHGDPVMGGASAAVAEMAAAL